ncbi:MAG: GyrI-like domain-containing protein [Rhodoglobus sp.]
MDAAAIDLQPTTILGVHETVPMQQLPAFFSRALGTAAAAISDQGTHPAGPPVAVYRGMPTSVFDVTVGFPVESTVTEAPGTLLLTLPAGRAAVITHHGSYESLPTTYDVLGRWMRKHGLAPAPLMWEQYLVGPESTPESAGWVTRIVNPVA